MDDLNLDVALLRPRFAQLVWVPGNHELWTVPRASGLRGSRSASGPAALSACC